MVAKILKYISNKLFQIAKRTFTAIKCVCKMSAKLDQNRLLSTILYLHFNLICSISLVLLNKWVYVNIGFPNLSLTLLHFVTTFFGLKICERFNLFQIKTVPLSEVCLLSATFCGFVIFTNLSLQYNTVGTYQLAKVMTTPVVVLLQIAIYHKKFSFKVKCTLIPIIAGVCMNFYYDIKFNIVGTLFAVLGVLVTSLYQILVSAKQHELQMNPMQLLYYQAPISSVMLFVFVLFLEPPYSTVTHIWTFSQLGMIFLSCLMALFVNISIYWIIGNTSPLTYNMVGHLKFCLTALGGFIIFNEPLSLMQALGVFITLSGVTFYAHLKLKESTQNQKSLEEG